MNLLVIGVLLLNLTVCHCIPDESLDFDLLVFLDSVDWISEVLLQGVWEAEYDLPSESIGEVSPVWLNFERCGMLTGICWMDIKNG